MPVAIDAVQMNTRIDRTLKREGDAALAAAGFTPSQAVRALWEIAVRMRDRPRDLAVLLKEYPGKCPTESCRQKCNQEEVIQDEKLRSFREGQHMIEEMIASLGISTEHDPSEPTLEELREQIALERLYGEGVE